MNREPNEGHSALQGVIARLQQGERLPEEAIREIDRVLGLLQGEGWSGFLPADDALRALIKSSREGERAVRLLTEIRDGKHSLPGTLAQIDMALHRSPRN